MFVLVAFESVLNGFFFAKGSEFGLVGGIGTAIGISIVNVALAFLIGLGPARWINFKSAILKLLGFVLSAAWVAGLVALHALAAHFREATAAVGEEQAMTVAVQSILQHPWSVNNLSSVYLFGLGILFALAAFWKGYTFDDPYPNYGPVTRRAFGAREDYSDEHAELFDDLGTIKEKTVDAIDQGISRIPLFPQNADAIRTKRAAMIQQFKAYEAAVETATNQLLAQYRDANRRHRTSPAPSYFDDRWALPHSFLRSAEVKTLTAEPDTAPPDVNGLLAELHQLSHKLLAEYEALMTRHPHPTQMQ